MATVSSQASKFKISDVSAVSQDLSCYVDGIDGLLPDMGTEDATTFCSTGRVMVATLQQATEFTISGPYDSAANGPDAVLSALWAQGKLTPFEYAPEGTAAGKRKYSGSGIVTRYKVTSRVGSIVRYSAGITPSGGVSVGSY